MPFGAVIEAFFESGVAIVFRSAIESRAIVIATASAEAVC
jgi:hypothetical protein